MPIYNAPGVYIEDNVQSSQIISQASSSIGVLLGCTKSGKVNTLQKITSWTEFIEKFSMGYSSPFSTSLYLPYAVYGFFQNGGNTLYVANIRKNATKASATGTSAITFEAASEGAWGNNIQVTIVKSSKWTETKKYYNITISSTQSKTAYKVSNVKFTTFKDALLENPRISAIIGNIVIGNNATDLAPETITLSGGSDGTTLTDADYIEALKMLDVVDDATFIAIPGQTSETLNTGLLDYCDEKGLFPILDMPIGSTVDETYDYRLTVDSFTGVLAYPWGKIISPASKRLVTVPTSGHLMGVYARIVETRGVFKVPAGLDATVNGFVSMETALTNAEVESLNPIGVVCIVAKPNSGIVVWGARSLNSSDDTMKYVSDGLLNLNIKKSIYSGTQFAIFEPNEVGLWSRLETACRSFLEDLRTQGALKGTEEEAYYVTVDSSNNTSEMIAAGELNIEIGYAPIKPAEFIIIKLSHSIQNGI